ncbi:MAG: GNAT family N-acetyltransferase, partial [Kiloniellaceae bacterium]
HDLTVEAPDAAPLSAHFSTADGRLTMLGAGAEPNGRATQTWRSLLAALEAVLGKHPELASLTLDLNSFGADLSSALAERLRRHGVAVEQEGALRVLPETLMQQAECWLAGAGVPAFPHRPVMSDGKRHPQRPPQAEGVVYARFIPWLGQSISFRVATLEHDLPYLHKWMNDPRVAEFWNEDGDLEKHRGYLSRLIDDPHMVPLIGCFDGVPFSYFEIYWAKENRLAPFYDAQDYDRGWHVVVGEDAYRGRQFVSAWLPSLVHYMLLDDCRTQRIVGEPAAAHHQQIRNLEKSGFAKVKNFDFPHKRATLVMMLRESFFGDRLWLPAAAQAGGKGTAAPRTAPAEGKARQKAEMHV